MKKAKDLIGKEMLHPALGLVEVTGLTPGSRTLVNVTCIDKGQGWNPERKRYTGIKKAGGWCRGQNYQHGNSDTVHFQALN